MDLRIDLREENRNLVGAAVLEPWLGGLHLLIPPPSGSAKRDIAERGDRRQGCELQAQDQFF